MTRRILARTGRERVLAVVGKAPDRQPPRITSVGGPVPMTADLAAAIREAIDEQRERERRSAS